MAQRIATRLRPFKAADLFCGAGGTSTGLVQALTGAGRTVDLTAVNHWPVAVETHAANHPEARHVCETLDSVDPRKLIDGELDLLVASPECTHHSIARGGKPINDQSRATAWHVLRWIDATRPKGVLLENVPEWESWAPIGTNGKPMKSRKGETFQALINAIRSLGYTVEYRVLVAADYGAATTRRRLFVMAVRGKGPIPWPDATHGPLNQPAGRRGPIRGTLFDQTLEPWRAAKQVIDWSIPSRSIFDPTRRPLSPKTIDRIIAGAAKFWKVDLAPFLFHVTHGGRATSLDRPFPTITGANRGELAVVEPFILPHRMFQQMDVDSVNDPLRTITGVSGKSTSLVEPFLVPFFGERNGQTPRTHGLDDPLPTITSHGAGGLCEPLLIPYCSNGGQLARTVSQPIGTITCRDRYMLVEVAGHQYALDIRLRMLQPHELAAGQGFPTGYKFAGNRQEQIKQIGNAVEVNQARALCAALAAVSGAVRVAA